MATILFVTLITTVVSFWVYQMKLPKLFFLDDVLIWLKLHFHLPARRVVLNLLYQNLVLLMLGLRIFRHGLRLLVLLLRLDTAELQLVLNEVGLLSWQ